MKKILIDALQYSNLITGTDRMSSKLIKELQNLDSQNNYRIICGYQHKDIQKSLSSDNFRPVRIIDRRGLFFSIMRKVQLGAYAYLIWPLWAPDVYYSFHNMKLPYIKNAGKTVSSVLDLIPILFKEYQTSPGHSRAHYMKNYRKVAKMTDQFVAISEYSKQDLHGKLNVPLNKITVMPLAVDPLLKPTPADLVRVKSKYRLPEKFIMAIGGNEPRKNVQLLLEAFKLLPKKIQSEYKVVIVGGAWRHHSLKELERPFSQVLGFVDDNDLPALYAQASIFVFPSRYEGFGIPILEAMLSETPVICSNSSSLPEVGGDAVLYLEDDSARDLAQKIEKLLGDAKLQQELVEKGKKQLQNFSWSRTAKILHSVLTSKI